MKREIWEDTQTAGLDDEAGAQDRAQFLDTKVMMVDDEPLMTDLIQTYLEDRGYRRFVVSNDPRDALELLRREQPGVLLLDLMMPQMSGFEVLEAIRTDRELRYTPVIVLTASTGADAKLRALQLGATDFLSKPVDESELVLRVRNTLAVRRYHEHMINYDSVTGLPHGQLFARGLQVMLERRDLVGGMVALLSVVVPECRQLRESVDQATADGLAKAIAHRLERLARDHGGTVALATSGERAPRVGRLGSDQFGLLLEGLADAEAVERAAKQVIARLSETVQLGLHEIVAGPSVGIALSPGDGNSAEALRKGADLAATHARTRGPSQFQFASAELNARSYERLTLGSQLRGATQRGEMRLHYQPKVDLRSLRVVGAEALVRWQHPEHGLVPPSRFIPLAEDLGVIHGIGQWVIERACRDAQSWAEHGYGHVKVAINVAKPQFMTGDLCSVLRQAMFDSGLQAQRLIVELTESMLMDDVALCLELMHEMKALGATLSIDDFGTGYSSLSYLKRFPLDELKIDRSFVMDLPGRQADVAVVRTVIELGHSLGMSVTAEGVETAPQLECLQRLGCDTFQGYLYSRPLPEDAFLALLAREAAKAGSAPRA